MFQRKLAASQTLIFHSVSVFKQSFFYGESRYLVANKKSKLLFDNIFRGFIFSMEILFYIIYKILVLVSYIWFRKCWQCNYIILQPCRTQIFIIIIIIE